MPTQYSRMDDQISKTFPKRAQNSFFEIFSGTNQHFVTFSTEMHEIVQKNAKLQTVH